MKEVPSYGKIINLGNPGTEETFTGDVVIQEKADGSQFGFGVTETGQLSIRSKGKIITEQCDSLFHQGWTYIHSIKDKILKYGTDVYFYCEYLKTPKHNVLKYDRIPKNHLVLFDCTKQGKFVDRETLEFIAKDLGIDVIPQLYVGQASVEKIKNILELGESFLGGEMIEGVVIKNYNQFIHIGGKVMPLFTKYVQEKFKEKHSVEWKDKKPKGQLQEFINAFKSEARWEKAYQHLRDNGELEQQPRDIAKLVQEIHKDLEEEEVQQIKNHLYKCYIKDIQRKSTQGLAEWYKEKLLENVK